MEPTQKYSTLISQIYHPPFDGIDETTSTIHHFGNDMICKVLLERFIDDELRMYQYLKDTGLSEKYKDYLINIDEIKKYRLTEDTIQSFVDKDWNVKYELVMPFIPYGNLLEYFFQFKMSSNYFSPYYDYGTFLINDTRKPIMPIDIFVNIWTKVILILINIIKDFNEHNFYHKDIKPNNIMYNPETGEFKLIDFGASKIQETPQETTNNNDLYLILENVVLFFLYVSLSNATIETQVTNIIKKIETLLYDKKMGIFLLNNVNENNIKDLILEIFDEITQINWDGLTDSADEPIKVFTFPLETNFKKLTAQEQIKIMKIRDSLRANAIASARKGGKKTTNKKTNKKMSKKRKQKRHHKSVKNILRK